MNINPRFKKFIPALQPDELSQLERNLISDGCRDPLVVWDGTLVDGHNRFAICEKHSIKFRTVEKRFESEDEACIWIAMNQFGRRNLQDFVRAELALRLEPLIRVKAKANSTAGGKMAGRGRPKVPENSPNPIAPIETRAEVAKIAGLSDNTITRVKRIVASADSSAIDKARAQGINGASPSTS